MGFCSQKQHFQHLIFTCSNNGLTNWIQANVLEMNSFATLAFINRVMYWFCSCMYFLLYLKFAFLKVLTMIFTKWVFNCCKCMCFSVAYYKPLYVLEMLLQMSTKKWLYFYLFVTCVIRFIVWHCFHWLAWLFSHWRCISTRRLPCDQHGKWRCHSVHKRTII